MTTYAFGGFPFGVDLDDLITEACQVHARTGNYAHLGSSTTIQNKRMAEIVNRAIMDFLRALPGLGLTYQTEITTVANQASYDIPTDLHGMAVNDIFYQNTGTDPSNDSRFLRYVSLAQVANMPAIFRNGTVTAQYPNYWTIGNFSAKTEALTGTVTVTNGSASVTGSGTLFTTELAANDEIVVYGQTLTVGTINSNTSLTLTSAWPVAATYSGMAAVKIAEPASSLITLYPTPQTSGVVLNVVYQLEPTTITATNVASRATVPTMINEIPTEFAKVVAMNVAINILTTDEMQERKQRLEAEYALVLQAAQKEVGAPEGADSPVASPQGFASDIVNTQSLFGGMSTFGIYGGW